MAARFLTVGEGSYKYRKKEERNEPCGVRFVFKLPL